MLTSYLFETILINKSFMINFVTKQFFCFVSVPHPNLTYLSAQHSHVLHSQKSLSFAHNLYQQATNFRPQIPVCFT